MNSSLILAASTPVVSSFRSSTPSPSSVNAVNDGSLPSNISEDGQQSSGTYKISTISSVHTCAYVFCFSWEFGNVCYWKEFGERAATVFEGKRRQPAAMLIINFSINWIYLESSCFYFHQMLRKMTKFGLNEMFENIILFLKRGAVVIKSRVVCFSPCSFTIKSLRYNTMNPTVSLYHFLKKLKMP